MEAAERTIVRDSRLGWRYDVHRAGGGARSGCRIARALRSSASRRTTLPPSALTRDAAACRSSLRRLLEIFQIRRRLGPPGGPQEALGAQPVVLIGDADMLLRFAAVLL